MEINSRYVPVPGTVITAKEIAAMIDHALLKPEMTKQDVIDGCLFAEEFGCAAVCVKPCDVEVAAEVLKGADVLVGSVIGFPHGHHLTEVKLLEAECALRQGCKELDMMLNIGRFLSGEDKLVEDDIRAVCELSHRQEAIVKVIIENYYMTDEQKVRACRICERAGADFVKTSTGYAVGGATIGDLHLMRKTCSDKVLVKAAGGVRTLDAALLARAAGAVRVGTTASKAIITEAHQREKAGTLKIPELAGELETGY